MKSGTDLLKVGIGTETLGVSNIYIRVKKILLKLSNLKKINDCPYRQIFYSDYYEYGVKYR